MVLVAFAKLPVFGTSLKATDILEMAHAFVALAPLRFLWAMKQAGLPQGLQLSDIPLGDNCMIVPWVDQNDVLGHPNTRAFVSHAGLHSVYEAAFHGVPLAAVPFHFESLDQALKLAHRGAAVISRHAPAFRAGDSQLAYTRQAVVELMREVLHNSSYTAAAEALSGTMQERAYGATSLSSSKEHGATQAAVQEGIFATSLSSSKEHWCYSGYCAGGHTVPHH
ncbi:hypothetical protein OEZ85_007570 [Tetradesmus obliquus]|uniref:UDP-glycosyltransferases domain-containing protein n=1 Tax=Tetradesmus obliquus TaxID=3088 RepID=A0ABY8TGI9_TETOB|nr:hypothetical protein OEZ85_007570 [Tetradesmus obliquus]